MTKKDEQEQEPVLATGASGDPKNPGAGAPVNETPAEVDKESTKKSAPKKSEDDK